MNIPAFFKFLNRKIEKYNKMATNPFLEPQPFVIIWVDESSKNIDISKNLK